MKAVWVSREVVGKPGFQSFFPSVCFIPFTNYLIKRVTWIVSYKCDITSNFLCLGSMNAGGGGSSFDDGNGMGTKGN